ncbi:MAG: hypothetical protein IPK15_27360 [Verrucomicrobia bacterium]|nr:hypothetical protein [Verrucomicrobiota bacterium]
MDVDYLATLLHQKPVSFLPELKGVIFLNPQTNRWETEDEYLSGNVQAKLIAAEATRWSMRSIKAISKRCRPCSQPTAGRFRN